MTENSLERNIDNEKTRPLWTVNDVAKYLSLTQETVRTMAREGKIPAFKIGRNWRFRQSEIKKSLTVDE